MTQCTEACVAETEAGDALARLALEEANRCALGPSPDCVPVSNCELGPRRFESPPDEDALCDLWDACYPFHEPDCRSSYDVLVSLDDAYGSMVCLYSELMRDCGSGRVFDRCYVTYDADPRCAYYCRALDACGQDGAGDDCRLACRQLASADPEAMERLRPSLDCVSHMSCPAFAACLAEAAPEPACADHCARRGQCEPALAPDACEEACLEDYARVRARQFRACVEEAEDCEAMARCELRPPAACDEYCERLVEWGYTVSAHCERTCDDRTAADPAAYQPRVDCVLSLPPWQGESVCDEGNPFAACSAYCRAGERCAAGAPGGEPECLAACGSGFAGRERVFFEAAAACLADLPAEAECDRIEACIAAGEQVDCAVLCGLAEACGVAPDDCFTVCQADPLGQLRAVQARDCLGAQEECAAVEACVTPPGPATPPPSRAELGTLFAACGIAPRIAYMYYPDLEAAGPESLECAMRVMREDCGYERDVMSCVDEPGDACIWLCQAREACVPVSSYRDCFEECLMPLDAEEADAVRRLRACGEAFDCAEFEACLLAAGPPEPPE